MALTIITKNADGSETTKVDYEGRVLRIYSRVVQVMSDVWEDWSFAEVVEANGKLKEVYIGGCYGDRTFTTAKVDAGAELLDALKVRAKAIEKARLAQRRAADAVDRFTKRTQLGRGDDVIVARGRKVPQGTKGVIIWTGEGNWGARCGVKDAAGTVHWTALKNCDLFEGDKRAEREANLAQAKVDLAAADEALKAELAVEFDAVAVATGEEVVLGLA